MKKRIIEPTTAVQFLRHYWEMTSFSSFGWTRFLLVLQQYTNDLSIDELQRLVVVNAQTNCEPKPPPPRLCTCAYLPDLASSSDKCANWLVLSSQLS